VANVLADPVWNLDTVGIITRNPIFVRSIRWVSEGAVAGDNVKFEDPDDATKVLWESAASGAQYTEEALIESTWWNGFRLSVLNSGKVYVTYG
jgi:hypothetical protein